MFKYEIKMNGEVIATRSSKNVYTHVSVSNSTNGLGVSAFHKTEKAAQKFAREHNNLVAKSEYHAKVFNNATWSVLEIAPDMVKG
jgi:hypothetical protein